MSTDARNQPRQPKGVPTGGQWRATKRPEGSTDLGADPEAAEWRAAGFSPAEAAEWRESGWWSASEAAAEREQRKSLAHDWDWGDVGYARAAAALEAEGIDPGSARSLVFQPGEEPPPDDPGAWDDWAADQEGPMPLLAALKSHRVEPEDVSKLLRAPVDSHHDRVVRR